MSQLESMVPFTDRKWLWNFQKSTDAKTNKKGLVYLSLIFGVTDLTTMTVTDLHKITADIATLEGRLDWARSNGDLLNTGTSGLRLYFAVRDALRCLECEIERRILVFLAEDHVEFGNEDPGAYLERRRMEVADQQWQDAEEDPGEDPQRPKL